MIINEHPFLAHMSRQPLTDLTIGDLLGRKNGYATSSRELLIKTSSTTKMNQADTAKRYANRVKEKFPGLQPMLKQYVSTSLQDEKLVKRLY